MVSVTASPSHTTRALIGCLSLSFLFVSQYLDNEYKYEDEIKNLTNKLREVKETQSVIGWGGISLSIFLIVTQPLPVTRRRAGRSSQSATM